MVDSTMRELLRELLSFGVWVFLPLASQSDLASPVCQGVGDTKYPSVRIHHLTERWSWRWVPCGCWYGGVNPLEPVQIARGAASEPHAESLT